jgi:hypothetical protein
MRGLLSQGAKTNFCYFFELEKLIFLDVTKRLGLYLAAKPHR